MSHEKFINTKTYKKHLKVVAIISIVLMSALFFAGYVIGSPDLSSVVEPGSMNIGVSYGISRDGYTYYTRNGETGEVTAGTNATLVITTAVANAENGTVTLSADYFDLDSTIVITSSVKLIGAGHTQDKPSVQPDYYPTVLYGTVLRTDQAINVIEIRDNVFNVELRDFAIEFTGASTGHGIKAYNTNAPSSYEPSITYGVFENIAVLDNDGSHYAYYFENFQHLACTLLRSWGGPFMFLQGNDYGIQYGNSAFTECYTYSYKTTSLPIFHINTTGVWTGNWTNLMTFNRLQINTWGTSAPQVMLIYNARYLTFLGCEIEADLVEVIKIDEHSSYITFINTLLWSTAANSIIWSDSDCVAITFIEGYYDIDKIQLQAVPNALINPHWLYGYRPTFYEPTNVILFENYTIATQSCDYNGVVTETATYIDILFTPSPKFNQTNTNYGIVALPNWETTVWFSNKATSGFRINFGTAAPAGALVDYFIFRAIK